MRSSSPAPSDAAAADASWSDGAVSGQGVHDFACVMRGIRVIDARTIEPEEVEDLLDAEPDDWSL